MSGRTSSRIRRSTSGGRPWSSAARNARVDDQAIPHSPAVELALQYPDLMAKSEDLGVLAMVAHRQQPQQGEHIRHTQTGKSKQHDRCRGDHQPREYPASQTDPHLHG
ncbi:hypothetical protein ACRJ4B_45725 [Streptomyces sp. GTA36]